MIYVSKVVARKERKYISLTYCHFGVDGVVPK